MWFLQLLMLTPLDDVVFQLPLEVKHVEVYVDDARVLIRGRTGTVVDIAVTTAIGPAEVFEEGHVCPPPRPRGR